MHHGNAHVEQRVETLNKRDSQPTPSRASEKRPETPPLFVQKKGLREPSTAARKEAFRVKHTTHQKLLRRKRRIERRLGRRRRRAGLGRLVLGAAAANVVYDVAER